MPDRKLPAAPVRSFWSGTITFGLVSIPVDLYAAARGRRTSMRLVDAQGHALGRRYYCPKHDKALKDDEIVRGYETEAGKMVVITDEEFASAAPEKSRDIELKSFVPLDAIPPAFFERPYFLAPGERAGKAYALLAQTMAKTGKAGIGSFVMRSHEYLVAIIADGGMLRAEVLRFADELRGPEAVGLPAPSKPKPALVKDFAKAIAGLAETSLAPGEMEDEEAEALRKFAERKAKSGQGVIELDDEDGDDDEGAAAGAEVVDLMEVLRRSLGAKAGADGAAGSTTKQAGAPAKKRASAAKRTTAATKRTPKRTPKTAAKRA